MMTTPRPNRSLRLGYAALIYALTAPAPGVAGELAGPYTDPDYLTKL
ncbi:MAG: hypothetical protein GW911_13225 [Armatimonadetes bacterium]|nr:hypothetical protein [Armatimonadota bacterium]NCO90906.1 hypothetical protein [Armatimonadota bacterium]NCP30464.1 hypothetical protein [Armatimonadota bacterium]NDK12992.1 hypothetical protein [Armatimonadota bacterium]